MLNSSNWSHFGTGMLVGLVILLGTFTVPRLSWAPPLIKIGVVNWEQVIIKYQDYQKELQGLQSKRKRILKIIEREYGKIKEDELKSGSGSSSTDQELQDLYQDTLNQHKQRRQQVIEEYHRKIMEAIRNEAIEQGYSLILSENEVLYAAEGYTDLTNGVIERLNQENGSD